MLKVVVGHSDDPDSQSAIESVLEQCLEDLLPLLPQAGILFAAIDFEHALILKQIHQVFPNLELIGCTTDGEMSSKLGFQQDSLTLMLFCSDTVQIKAGVGYETQNDPTAAAKQAVQKAMQPSAEPKLCIALPSSYTANGATTSGEGMMAGLTLALGEQVPVLGGTAGDQYRFKTTYQFFRTEVLIDALPILIFSGDLHVSYGTACGWTPMGAKGVVTKAQGTVLYEIDGKPAVEFYQRYLGDRPPSAENPLAVYEAGSDGSDSSYYMRVPNASDPEVGSIHFLCDIPENSLVQLTEISRDILIAASETSFQTALSRYPGTTPTAVLLFSCCCRRWLLGTRAKEEYLVVKNALETPLPICGFYTYGEFSPLESHGKTYYHQETFVTLLIGTES
ncbi:MAG: FIST C-terminal domain-containing protein [Timaviella obliquedivisa GSE-PSE-MK23-08B]|jgi:hypothetical protein|nr:FIST C-terminal domain-containing protein [Timaviella obliquedivisa GSE-PSE-MK23-08B]